jgi:hypothetical protein
MNTSVDVGLLNFNARETEISEKQWYLPASSPGITTQNTNISVFTTVRPSNLVFITRFCGILCNKFES